MRAVLATGERLVGGGVRGFESAVMELLEGATSEVQLAAYSFDPSSIPLINDLGRLARSGLRVTAILRSIEAQHPAIRRRLEAIQHYARIVDFSKVSDSLLHMKVLVVDRRDALLGSANFTWGGMVTNHELGVWLDGPEAWTLSALLDKLSAP